MNSLDNIKLSVSIWLRGKFKNSRKAVAKQVASPAALAYTVPTGPGFSEPGFAGFDIRNVPFIERVTRRVGFKKKPNTFNKARRHFLAGAAATAIVAGNVPAALAFLYSGGVSTIAAGNLPITFTLNNITAATSFTTPNVTYGHPFADGDIPPGGSITVKDSNNNPVPNVQMDAIATWPSGCPKFVAISHPCAETFVGGAQLPYTLNSSATAPNKTVNTGLWGVTHADWFAALSANSDFKVVHGPGFDAGIATYTTSMNSIRTNYSERNPGYGTAYPTGGWEITKYGPNCIEFHGWQYIKNDSSGKFHGYVRCDMWVKAWSPTGPYETYVRTSMPNTWNTITASSTTSEQYNIPQGRFATLVQVKNGSTVIKYDGGPNDINAQIVPNTNFNTTTKQLNYQLGTFFPQTGVYFTSTGAVPTGLTANTLYWPSYLNGGSDDPYLITCRQYCSLVEQNGTRPGWLPNTPYNVNAWIINNGVQYLCTAGGTSAASGGPTGGALGSDIIDGSVHWTNISVGFSDQGSGTIKASPVSMCFPQSAFVTAGDYGDAIWSGSGTRPTIVVGHNFNYLTQKSKFTLPYNINAGSIASNLVQPTYLPSRFQAGMLWSQSQTGASGQRIGHINAIGVQSLFKPADPWAYYGVLQGACCWHMSAYAFMGDESDGNPLHTTNGPGNAGGSYPGLNNNITNWTVFNVPGAVSPVIVPRSAQWSPWDYSIQNQNGTNGQYYADPTHVPFNAQMAYCKTGHPIFLDAAVWLSTSYLNMVYQGSQTVNSTTYYCLVNGAYGSTQLRGWAWSDRTLFNTFFMLNDDHLFYGVIKDGYEMNLQYEADRINFVYPPAQLTCGVPNCLDHDNGGAHIAPWMMSFYLQTTNLEGWRGGQTAGTVAAIATNCTFLARWWDRYATSVNALAINYFGCYDQIYAPTSQDWANCYTNYVTMFTACTGLGGLPAPWPPVVFDYYSTAPNNAFQVGFPGNTDCYHIMAIAALKVATKALPANTTISAILSNMQAAFAGATGISQSTGSIQWWGTSAGVQQSILTHAAF